LSKGLPLTFEAPKMPGTRSNKEPASCVISIKEATNPPKVYQTAPDPDPNAPNNTNSDLQLFGFEPLTDYVEDFNNSPQASICINAIAQDASDGVAWYKTGKEDPSNDEIEKAQRVIDTCYVSPFGNFWRDSIEHILKSAGNLPVEPIFSAKGDGSLLGFKCYKPKEVEDLVDTSTGEIVGFARTYSKYDGALPTTDYFQKYPMPTFETFPEDFELEIDPETGGLFRYMFYIKGHSDYVSMFGSYPNGILDLLGFDYEQVNTLKEFTSRGFQGSVVFYIKSDHEDAVYKGFGAYSAETNKFEFPSLMETFKKMATSGDLSSRFAMTFFPLVNGVEVTTEELTVDIDLAGYLAQSKDIDEKIRAWFRIPASALFIEGGASGMNSDRITQELKMYNLKVLPSIAGALYRPVNVLVSRHISDKLKLFPKFEDPTSKFEVVKAQEIEKNMGTLTLNEIRAINNPDLDPLEEIEITENDNKNEQEEIEENE